MTGDAGKNKTVWFIEDDGQVSFMNFNVGVSRDAEEYWYYVDKLVDGVGLVESRRKLRSNFKDPATAFKVQKVMDDYYGGRIDRLEFAIRKQVMKNRATLTKINRILDRNGLRSVQDKTVLAEFLQESRNRKKVKKIAEKYRKVAVLPLDKIIEWTE